MDLLQNIMNQYCLWIGIPIFRNPVLFTLRNIIRTHIFVRMFMVLSFVTDDKWLEITKIYSDMGLD